MPGTYDPDANIVYEVLYGLKSHVSDSAKAAAIVAALRQAGRLPPEDPESHPDEERAWEKAHGI